MKPEAKAPVFWVLVALIIVLSLSLAGGGGRRLVYRNLDAKEHLTGLLPYAIIML